MLQFDAHAMDPSLRCEELSSGFLKSDGSVSIIQVPLYAICAACSRCYVQTYLQYSNFSCKLVFEPQQVS